MILKHLIYSVLISLMLSCNITDHIRTYRLTKSAPKKNPTLSESKENTSFGLTWEKPKNWITTNKSSMRIASFDVPYSNGIGDLSIIELSGEGGGIEANVNRWRGQIGLGPISKSEIEVQGESFTSTAGNGLIFHLLNPDEKKLAILAAILSLNNSTLFIKLNAPFDGILEIEKDFKLFCTSINLNF